MYCIHATAFNFEPILHNLIQFFFFFILDVEDCKTSLTLVINLYFVTKTDICSQVLVYLRCYKCDLFNVSIWNKILQQHLRLRFIRHEVQSH